MDLWSWRMRGGANDEIIAKYTEATERAAQGEFDSWADEPIGRLALIILLDQFPRTVWAGTAKAYAQDPKALHLCLEGLENGHFDALENVWFKSVFKLPMEHCECPNHLANLDRVIAIADQIKEDAPDNLKDVYEFAAGQPRKHRAVIAQFGRHSHRNEVLGRISTPAELDYISKGIFPHEVELKI
ncbi:putative transmembrane protein [Celeribacter marinus]|uniref:Putative transmembrane protein n=2 Tax=Celeribacter marinus TaxID=1397108 RepID=A0A0N7HJ51_9RHOB|nr:putative transmembrane protein [Celeribacter marinus]